MFKKCFKKIRLAKILLISLHSLRACGKGAAICQSFKNALPSAIPNKN